MQAIRNEKPSRLIEGGLAFFLFRNGGAMKRFFYGIVAIFLVMILAVIANAAPVEIQSANIWRSNRGQNSIGWDDGDRLVVACTVEPANQEDEEVVATNPDTEFSLKLSYIGGANPNEYGRSIDYDPAKTGLWTFLATNGPDSDSATSQPIGDVSLMPFLRNVQLTGAGLTPTISWTVPGGSGADRIAFTVIDGVNGIRLWSSEHLSLENTEYTIPDGVLEFNKAYVIRAMLQDTVSGDMFGPDKSRSESFFNFTPLEDGESQEVYIPTVSADTNSADEFGASFSFDIDVEEGVPCLIDPFVAIGYDYAVGDNDTVRFASVTLPEIGDNLFDLYLFNGLNFYLAKKDLMAGQKFDFAPGGVKRFRVLGIAKSEELDPNDTTAFITELTFTGTGQFTGTMTPITALIPDSYTSQICSTLGDDLRPFFVDQDIFEFEASKDEGVLVRLEKGENGFVGDRATLVLSDKIRKTRVFEIDCSELPSEIKIQLPAAGKYMVTVAEQPRLWYGKRFRGNYCLSLRSTDDAFMTLEPTRWVE